MLDTLTDQQIDWARSFTGLNITMGGGAAGPGEGQAEPGGFFDDLAAGFKKLGQSMGIVDPDPPSHIDPPIVGPAQQKRADAAKAKLSPEDKKKFEALVDGAKSEKEKQYLTKGLAAGHSVAELDAFEKKIAGKDEKWMRDNLSLTGNSEGKGIKQQWSMSCNATTVQAVRGELDPLYSLKMHEDNPHLTDRDDDHGGDLNKQMAADQKAMLETADEKGYHGVAASAHDRNDPHKGRWNTDLLNNSKDSTGLSYKREMVAQDTESLSKAVQKIADAVDKGMPVPIVIGDGTSHKNAHYVLVTASDPGPPRSFSIHDPWNGTTEVRTADEMTGGKIDLAGDPKKKGSGWNKLSAIEMPTEDAPPTSPPTH